MPHDFAIQGGWILPRGIAHVVAPLRRDYTPNGALPGSGEWERADPS